MNSISQQSAHPIRFEFLGFGDSISETTMQKMKKIINDSVRNYYVRRWAEKIIEGSRRDDISRVTSIYNFLSQNTYYVKDPIDLELLKTPPVSLQLIEVGEKPGLDCDDLTILSLSLIKSIGMAVAMRATSYSLDKRFSHIYGLVKINNRWTPFDLVRDFGIGGEASGMTRVYDMEV